MTFAVPRQEIQSDENNNSSTYSNRKINFLLPSFPIIAENIPSPSIQNIRWANPSFRESVDISSSGSLSDRDKRPALNSSYPP